MESGCNHDGLRRSGIIAYPVRVVVAIRGGWSSKQSTTSWMFPTVIVPFWHLDFITKGAALQQKVVISIK